MYSVINQPLMDAFRFSHTVSINNIVNNISTFTRNYRLSSSVFRIRIYD